MNLTRLFKNIYIQIITVWLLILGVMLIISTPDISFFKWTANFAIQTTILYILAGLFFLIVSSERLMLMAFFCAGCLSLFLKGNFNPNFKLSPVTSEKVLSIATLKFEGHTPDKPELYSILKNNPDVICCNLKDSIAEKSYFQEVSKKYDYSVLFKGKDFEQVIFSKYPFVTADTILFEGNPQVLFSLRIYDDKIIYFNSSFIEDPFKNGNVQSYRSKLSKLIVFLKPVKSPLIVSGDFNAVSWSGELNYFRKTLELLDCRRAFFPSLPNPLEIPTDQIFFSKFFDCVDFHEFRDINGNHLGLYAGFQLKNEPIIKANDQSN